MANTLLKMGNAREEKMTGNDSGYLAAMIEGDGCIGSQKNSNARTYRPYIVVVQKYPEIIDWLSSNFGGTVDLISRQHGVRKCHYFRWTITNQKAVDALKFCFGDLKAKKAQAELAISMVETTNSGCLKGQRVPDGLIERQKNIYLKIKGLNSPATTERADSDLLEMQQSELTRMKNREREIRSSLSR